MNQTSSNSNLYKRLSRSMSDILNADEDPSRQLGAGYRATSTLASSSDATIIPVIHSGEPSQSETEIFSSSNETDVNVPSAARSERPYWRRRKHQISMWLLGLKKSLTPPRLTRVGMHNNDYTTPRNKISSDHTKDRLSSSHPNVSHVHMEDYNNGSGHQSAGCSAASSPRKRQDTSEVHLSNVSFRNYTLTAASSITSEPRFTAIEGDEVCQTATAAEISSYEKQHYLAFLKHPFYELDVWLQSGRNLIAKDSCGTSDPYVKFKIAGKMLYKSKTVHKNLNPEWNEKFILPIEDVFQPLIIKVYDYDWGLHDDFMGTATVSLVSLDFNKPTDLKLELSQPSVTDVMGTIHMVLTLNPCSQKDKEQFFQRNVRLSDSSRKMKSQIWSSVVTIVLVEGKDFGCKSAVRKEELPYCLYVKFRLGNGKYKSKCCQMTSKPLWREQFDLHMFDDQSKVLEINVFDGSRYWEDMIGRCHIDLTEMEHEKTQRIWKKLDNDNGALFLLLTISGTTSSETITDLTNNETQADDNSRILRKYSLSNTLDNMKDVGHLTVKVYEAQGLASADLGGKSDPFCVLELVNARLQTQTEYKTLSPLWRKVFTFNVKDINSVLEVTVYDEDKDHKVEFLGKIVIPLLKIKQGEKKWYALKDRKLRSRVKGEILLELEVIYNVIRACVRTFHPKEEKYIEQEEKFKKRIFVNNVLRVREMVRFFIDAANFIQSCLEWESPVRSTITFVIFLVVTYNFQLYMTPFAFLLIFLVIYIKKTILKSGKEEVDQILKDDDDDERDKEEKKSLKERLQAIQDVILTVQVALGKVASIWESIKNTFNFTVPFLSWTAIIILCIFVFLLYYVPLRVIIIIWGINKFTKKLRSPHAVTNNELLDFLSRVPDDEHLFMQKELKVIGTNLERTAQRPS